MVDAVARTGSRFGRLRRPRTLRRRLVVVVSLLLAATSIAIGSVTIIALRGYLVAQLDSRLAVAAQRSLGPRDSPPADAAPPHPAPDPTASDPRFIGAPGQSPDTVIAAIKGDRFVVSGFVDARGVRHSLDGTAESVLRQLTPDARPVTRNMGDALGSYRLVAARAGGGTVVVTGLPLAPVDAVTNRLILVVAIVTASGLILAAAVGAATVQRALRPLRRVAETASAVTGLDLDQGDVPDSMRVSTGDIGATVEVGQVGSALNRLLTHMTAALRVRRHAESRMRDFVADASHELRTPLSTIRAYAELSRRDFPDAPERLRVNIQRIESESVRMSALVDELLLLARLDSASEPPHRPVELSRLLAETVTDAQAAAPDHRWIIHLGAEPVVIDGDESALRRAIVNLLTNARTHTPAGSVVECSVSAEPDGTAVITIADDGPGIPAERQGEIFERFARGDASRSRDSGGTGLGLAIVAAIAKAHHGRAEVDSTAGCTVFRLIVPRGASAAE